MRHCTQRILVAFFLLCRVLAESDTVYSEDYEDPEYFYDETEEDAKSDRSTSSEWIRKLERDVLPKALDPPYSDSEKVDVQLLFSSFDHISLDEKHQLIRIHGRFCMVWYDQRLLWDPAEYNGVSDLHVSPDDVWVPKFKVLLSSSRYRDHFEAQKEKVHIFVNRLKVNLAYVVTCPRFHVRTGCSLDMSRYPNDEHMCNFMLSMMDDEHININNYHSVNENQAQMRHILSKNETRPNVGDFTITHINSTTKYWNGEELLDESGPHTTSIAAQYIYLKRNAPAFFSTYTVPSWLFSTLNISAAISVRVVHSVVLFLANIFFISLFLRDVTEHLPLHFNVVPDIVFHWTICLCIAIFGLLYFLIKEILRQREKEPRITLKVPTEVGGVRSYILARIFSFSGAVVFISLLSSILFL